ncbi:CIC11C00000001077 [Sungouiella intermedia]|uniref:CIC11C00000001077 n=1 Tax=Sungouiella intermedia TaxID=45354 RepID=A0A1L0CWL2_9ASCO|nr:CIC11C00000001077 [[Candida] intermedia]
MKRELYGQLDALQSRLCDLDELTLDSDSIISGTTAATSVQLSPRKESARKSVPPPLVSSQSVPLQCGTVLLHNVLDCLNDMALQESAQIEQCLAEVATALELCVAMNTYTIEKTGMFPHKR